MTDLVRRAPRPMRAFVVDGVCFVIDLPDSRIASVSLRPLADDKVWWLFGLRVAKEFRRSGNGTALMERAKRWAREHGVLLHLLPETECEMTNGQLAAWYQRLGFARLPDGSVYEPGHDVYEFRGAH